MPQPHRPAQRFEVVSQEHSFRYGTDGTQSGQWTITFKTPSGVTSQIIVPDAAYSKDAVAMAIAHQVQHIEAVHSLTEGTPPAPPERHADA